MLLEIDGEHHRKPVRFNGISQELAEEVYINCVKRDKIKTDWALENKIPLLRIEYSNKKDLENLKINFKKLLLEEIEKWQT